MSIVLPAVNGMITRIGLAGQLCAQLRRGSDGVMAAAAMSRRWRRRVCCRDVPPFIGRESPDAFANLSSPRLLQHRRISWGLSSGFRGRASPAAVRSRTKGCFASGHPRGYSQLENFFDLKEEENVDDSESGCMLLLR
jgi:hypothetical protein